MKTHDNNKQSGFTLIELLVAVSIIGVLASITLVFVQSAKKSATNAYVLAESVQIKNQMSLYYLDTGAYPNPTGKDFSMYCISSTDICQLFQNQTQGFFPGLDISGNTSGTQLALAEPTKTENTFWSLLNIKTAEAASSTVTFQKFNNVNMKTPVYYYCSQDSGVPSNKLCANGSAWLATPVFSSGNTITYKLENIDDISKTIGGGGGNNATTTYSCLGSIPQGMLACPDTVQNPTTNNVSWASGDIINEYMLITNQCAVTPNVCKYFSVECRQDVVISPGNGTPCIGTKQVAPNTHWTQTSNCKTTTFNCAFCTYQGCLTNI